MPAHGLTAVSLIWTVSTVWFSITELLTSQAHPLLVTKQSTGGALFLIWPVSTVWLTIAHQGSLNTLPFVLAQKLAWLEYRVIISSIRIDLNITFKKRTNSISYLDLDMNICKTAHRLHWDSLSFHHTAGTVRCILRFHDKIQKG